MRCGQRYFGGSAGRPRCEFCSGRITAADGVHSGARRRTAPLPAVRPPLPEAREHDIGLTWRDRSSGRTYRAAWIEATGELFVVQTGAPEEGGGHIEVLVTGCDAEHLSRVLPGWRELVAPMGSLDMLRQAVSAG